MTRRAAVAGDVAARRAIVAFLVSSSDADRHAILRLSDRRHFEVQTPDPDLIEHPGPPHRTAKHIKLRDRRRRRRQAKMPWQSAPSLLIIIGAFNVAAGAMWSIQRIAYGKVRSCKFRVGISSSPQIRWSCWSIAGLLL